MAAISIPDVEATVLLHVYDYRVGDFVEYGFDVQWIIGISDNIPEFLPLPENAKPLVQAIMSCVQFGGRIESYYLSEDRAGTEYALKIASQVAQRQG